MPFDIIAAKQRWLDMLGEADRWVRSRPAHEAECLYYSKSRQRFVVPDAGDDAGDIVPHFGRSGGVLPQPVPG